jgi:hypothetical protein
LLDSLAERLCLRQASPTPTKYEAGSGGAGEET